uniref:Uncharacterized protein n=1 Tax=Sinorhizobium meliloti (strain SM11) TaxID=707241 RepID=Q1WLK8_SINMM|nr:hypothetical protein [Sinorhizobium meliloti]
MYQAPRRQGGSFVPAEDEPAPDPGAALPRYAAGG